MDVLGGKRLAAFGAHHDRIEHLAAVLVLMKQRPAAGIDHVRVTPMGDRHDHRIKVEPLLRQDLLVSLQFSVFPENRDTTTQKSNEHRGMTRCLVLLTNCYAYQIR